MQSKDLAIIIVGAIIFSLVLGRLFPDSTYNKTIVSPLSETIEKIGSYIPINYKSPLGDVVDKSLSHTQGTYGIVIKNLRTGEKYSQNTDLTFQPASLYKLWVLGAAFKQISEGTLDRDETLSRNVKDLNEIFDIASDSAELTEEDVTMKVQNAIEEMITVSHNYAALLLVSKIRNSNIANFMKEQGFSNSRLGQPPQTTAKDIASFFEKLYNNNIIDGESSQEMMEILSRQKLNDRIPKYLPAKTVVAHKTGEIGEFKHDAGIIFGKDPILFVVLSESESPASTAERIAQLSRNVLSYFEDETD